MSVRGAPGKPLLVAYLEFLAPDRDQGVVWDDAKILGVSMMPPGWGVFGDETALRALASACGRLVIVVCLGLMPFRVLNDLTRFLYLANLCNRGACGLCVVLLGPFHVHIKVIERSPACLTVSSHSPSVLGALASS